MLPILLALASAPPVAGDAAFSYRIESAAEVRGIELGGLDGCAVLDCSLLGERAWVHVADGWQGPLVVVDCTAAQHRGLWAEWGRAVDLPWEMWQELGLPLAPVPALVVFEEPRGPEPY